jgi:hypothetical protein
MKSTIDAIVGILMIALAGTALAPLYHWVKKETLTQVYAGLHQEHLETFTRKLTHTRLKY